MLYRTFSASSLINELVSVPFFNNILVKLSRYGSMHLLRETNISPIVNRAILESDDLRESAIFISDFITVLS